MNKIYNTSFAIRVAYIISEIMTVVLLIMMILSYVGKMQTSKITGSDNVSLVMCTLLFGGILTCLLRCTIKQYNTYTIITDRILMYHKGIDKVDIYNISDIRKVENITLKTYRSSYNMYRITLSDNEKIMLDVNKHSTELLQNFKIENVTEYID